jgi:hypothetical protein
MRLINVDSAQIVLSDNCVSVKFRNADHFIKISLRRISRAANQCSWRQSHQVEGEIFQRRILRSIRANVTTPIMADAESPFSLDLRAVEGPKALILTTLHSSHNQSNTSLELLKSGVSFYLF